MLVSGSLHMLEKLVYCVASWIIGDYWSDDGGVLDLKKYVWQALTYPELISCVNSECSPLSSHIR